MTLAVTVKRRTGRWYYHKRGVRLYKNDNEKRKSVRSESSVLELKS